jgi:P-type Mg2+ transporter
VGTKIGMVHLPGEFFGWLAATVVAYCALTQVAKVVYIRRYEHWL